MKAEYVPYILGCIVFIIIIIGIIIHIKTEGYVSPDVTIAAWQTAPTTTTKPIVVKKLEIGEQINQRANTIYFGTSSSSTYNDFTVLSVDKTSVYGSEGMNKVISIPISKTDDPYVIKQIYVEKFGKNTDLTGEDIRIGVVDTINNKVNFVGLNYNLTGGPDPRKDKDLEAAEIMYNRITQKAISSQGLYIDDARTIYGTDIIGNRINILTSNATITKTDVSNIIITGYKESQKWKPDMLLDIKGPVTNIPNNEHVLIRQIKVTKSSKSSILKDGMKFRITFTNSYSNNVFTYPGPVNGMFIYCEKTPDIYLSKILITNRNPIIIFEDSTVNSVMTVKPDTVAIIDYYYFDNISPGMLTQFRLEYNLTDLLGSINPVDVCPNVQGLIDKQLDAETIVDSMEYLDKINTEKVKLSSNKENLLTLMEQEEDIKKLENMIEKIKQLGEQRTREADALNALQFTRQLNEVMKLREELEKRIAARKQNTLTLDFKINDADAAASQGLPDSRDMFNIS